MKPMLVAILLIFFIDSNAQTLDYISVRKSNGGVLKNFYRGSSILLQTQDGRYIQGPIDAIRNDSIFITLYDIRLFPTNIGTYVRDTISVSLLGLSISDIKRIHLSKKRSFVQRTAGPLLMLGGGGYFALNVLNGAFFNYPLTDNRTLRTLGISAGAFGLGYLIHKLFSSDGFSKAKHQIVYVHL